MRAYRVFFFKAIEAENKEWTARLHRKRKNEEVKAEADKLDQFGSMLLIRALCDNDWTKSDYYLQSPFESFMYLLYMDKEMNEYQERLNKVQSEIRERKAKARNNAKRKR